MEYIERDVVVALFEEKQKALCPLGRCSRNMVYGAERDLYDAIDSDIDTVLSIPPADVAKIKRGSWEKDPTEIRGDGEIYDYRCSLCKGKAPEGSYGNHDVLTDYCPNCGADMRGDKV